MKVYTSTGQYRVLKKFRNRTTCSSNTTPRSVSKHKETNSKGNMTTYVQCRVFWNFLVYFF